ncbi:NUDIX domain-containing protein [Candidatus Roizmanbacteria bacterium]|nr:NUDIX domain-containing protein [Candidatus Roizmanbacteria bacterium]
MTHIVDPDKAHYLFTNNIKFLQKVLIFHPTDQTFLALKRSSEDISRPNCWDLPGGNVAFGELNTDALEREVKEETNLSFSGLEPVIVTTSFDKNEERYYLFIGYKARASSTLVTLSHEHSEFRWVTKDEFMEEESADFLQKLVQAYYELRHKK